MKRILSIIIIISFAIMSYAKVPTPDFAYPKTVSKTAMSDLKTANKNHDAAAAINALIRYSIAEGEIDRSSLQESIKLIEKTAKDYVDDDLHGLFDCLLATIYLKCYENERWRYDQRQLPLTPLPEDLYEWSGAQFQAKIDSLSEASISPESIEKLKRHDIRKYSDIIIASDLTAVFYPTLADFAYDCASRQMTFDKRKDVVKRAFTSNVGYVPGEILWQIDIDTDSEKPFEALQASYEKYKDNQYSALIFEMLCDNTRNDLDQLRYIKTAGEEFIARFPHATFINNVKNSLNEKLSGRGYLFYPNLCAKDTYFDVDIHVENAIKYTIKVYYLGENVKEYGKKIKEAIIADNPVQVREMTSSMEIPFQQDTTVRIKLDRYGYYYLGINPTKDDYSYQTIRCVPTIPISIESNGICQVITTEPLTGAPIAGSKVKLSTERKPIKTINAITDQDGIASLNTEGFEDNTTNVSINIDGKEYAYPSLNHWMPYRSNVGKEKLSCNILTDRSIYHPGDKLQVLGVVYESKVDDDRKSTSSLCEGFAVTFQLNDANYNKVAELETQTDEMGRATGEFTLPTTGLTGQYQVILVQTEGNKRLGNKSVMVSDYKMPDFEVIVDAVECDTPTKGDVTINGHATSYSGVPMSDASVNITLKESQFWWRNFYNAPIYAAEIKTDTDGKFSTVIPDSVFKAYPAAVMYKAIVEAVSTTGSTASTERSFSLEMKYHITVNIANMNVNGEEPLRPDVKVYQADGTQVEIPLEWALIEDVPYKTEGPNQPSRDTIASGDYYGAIDISNVKPRPYFLSIKAKDTDLANTAGTYITVYNQKMGLVPADERLWVKDETLTADDNGQANLLIGTGKGKTYVYCVRNTDGLSTTKLYTYDYGYHTLKIDSLPSDKETQLHLICVNDLNTYDQRVTISPAPKQKLKITGESFRDKLIPGEQETWHLQVTNPDGTPAMSALALDMYNKALDALTPQNFGILFSPIYISSYFNINLCESHLCHDRFYQATKELKEPGDFLPRWNFYGREYTLSGGRMVRVRGMNSLAAGAPMMKQAADLDGELEMVQDDAVVYASASLKEEMYDSAAESVVEGKMDEDMGVEYTSANTHQEFEYRDSDVPLAIWAPTLTTDAQGNVRYTFTVPNANTTWRLRAVAWAKDMNVGSLMRDFVASKPVMVMPNIPRYLRAGDTATIVASVINNTDETCTVTTTVEIFNPLTQEIISTKEFTHEIAPKLTAKVSADIFAPADMGAIGYRVKASNGTFADGEQCAIKILSSDATLIETEPFYLNPGETEWNTVLPKETNARLSMTFCENPAWTIVTALPGLRNQIDDYANSAAAALYSAAIARGLMQSYPKVKAAIETWRSNPSDSALVSMLEKNEDLKLAVLNSTPWVQAAQSDTERMANLALIFDDQEVDKSIAAAIKILKDLQLADGGWAWGKWCKESSVWITGNVLDMLGDLKKMGWLPADKDLSSMISKALRYYDSMVEKTDMMYTLVRPAFSDVAISANGRAVINATLADIRKHWKQYTDPSYKALAAEALYLNGDKAMARTLLVSVSEFGVYTKNQGLRFPNVNALYSYAVLLEAYGLIEPKSKQVDGLRQQLIVRKQATDWGDAVVTTEVVRSILATGTDWMVEARGAEVTAGNTLIEPKGAIETSTGSFTADLSSHAGETLTVKTTGTGPAYGAVYAQYERKMTDVEAYSIDDLSIEKQMYVRRGTEWETWTPETQLEVGDRVKVQLVIHSKRNLQYVTIIDERPAAFEPVEQLPGWIWSEGVGFYRENRDSATNMHVIYMSPGTYLLTYEMNVNLAGTFSSGVASIQSQYAPEISAHSAGTVITTRQNRAAQ